MVRHWLLSIVLLPLGCSEGTFHGWTGSARESDSGAQWRDALPPLPSAESSQTYEPKQTMYSHSGEKLFRIDPTQLMVVEVGSFAPNAPHMTDLAVTPDGRLYAISNNNLYTVDPVTARVSWVAKVPGMLNVALTFDIDGKLLASDKKGGFRRIDPTSGQVVEIGSFGPGMGSSGDLVAIKDGTLYDVNDVGAAKYDNELITVDPASGTARRVGPIGFRMVWGLSFWGGTLYGFTRRGEFISIDPETGRGSLIQSYTHEFWGAAVTPKAPLTLY